MFMMYTKLNTDQQRRIRWLKAARLSVDKVCFLGIFVVNFVNKNY